MVKPGEHPCIAQLCDNSEFLDMAVSVDADGDLIYSTRTMALDPGIAILHAWEGASLSLPSNRRVKKHIITGVFYIVGVEKEKLRSLTDSEITKYMARFWEPELYTDDEIIDSWFDGLFCAL